MKFDHRSEQSEIMDDFNQPESEFDSAYHELEIVNRRLGGVRAIERFLPQQSKSSDLLMLDVGAGGCDVAEALLEKRSCRVVVLDLNARGLKLGSKSWPVVGDALDLPFADKSFDVVMASLFFHHLSDDDCVRVLQQMWRIARWRVLVNDLHRQVLAYFSISVLTRAFSKSRMVRHDAPVSVLRAFRPSELAAIARRAGIPAVVHRSFPYRLVLVAEK